MKKACLSGCHLILGFNRFFARRISIDRLISDTSI
jgi:hypothetical protein